MATGGLWQSKLVYVQYDGKTVCARHELLVDLAHILNESTGIFSASSNSPLRSKITKASAFIIDLPLKILLPFKVTQKVCTHHFIELETKSGDFFTRERK